MFFSMGKEFAPSLKNIPFLKDAPARALRAAGKEATWFSVPAGSPLFKVGEISDSIYFVLSGSLGTFRHTSDGNNEFIGHIRVGEPVGEMALFIGSVDEDGDGEADKAPHALSVYALRDTEMLEISRAGFRRLIKAEPEILEAMIRLILLRLRRAGSRSEGAEPRVFGLVAASPTIELSLRAEALQKSLARMGVKAAIIDEEMGDDKPPTFFDEIEAKNDIVLLISPVADTYWYRTVVRQADRIWVIGRADARPSHPLMPEDKSPIRSFKLVDVVLLHHGGERKASRPAEWMDAAGAVRVFHWSKMEGPACDSLARVMAGRSVGLVLSGGGARAYAHIGAIRAMRERGIPIDFVGGTSMGGVIAACVAMGWDDDEIDRRIRKAFVESNPLGDYNLPVVGMVRGRRVNNRLKEHFGDAEIGDLRMPFFAVSTNLTDGNHFVHRRGLVWKALRASIALPGILPPVVDEGDLLVDGGVMNNYPVEVLRDLHRGYIIGSDVTRVRRGLNSDDFIDPPGFFSWVMRHGFSAPPPIAGLLMRAATVSTTPTEGRSLTDVMILPELDDVELRDWKAYDQAVEAGYDAAVKALEGSETLFAQAMVGA